MSSYQKLEEVYSKYFSLSYLGTDINSKFAVISLLCYLTHKVKEKNPNVSHYQVIKKLLNNIVPEKVIVGLSIVCSDFAYGCSSFLTFGLTDSEIPAKVKEIMSGWTPF